MLPSKNRLRHGFDNIYKGKQKISNPYFILFYKENSLKHSRFGFVIRKKLGKAHLRNKVKRRFRFVIRENLSEIKTGFDFIFLVNHNLKDQWKEITFEDIKENIINILKKVDKL
ncbi:ribonuclease P protein component [Patescibacteria group bacterium]|nr:ribonuclease P protein component [Patescibacteria group bacterium]